MRALLLLLALAVQPLRVDSVKLWDDYHADVKVADAKYRDKPILITGKVREISSTYTIYFAGGAGAKDGVTTRWAGAEVAKAGSIRVGDRLTLSCTGAGIVFDEPILLECRFP